MWRRTAGRRGLAGAAALLFLPLALAVPACRPSHPAASLKADDPSTWSTWIGIDARDIAVPPQPAGAQLAAERAERDAFATAPGDSTGYVRNAVFNWLRVTIEVVRSTAIDGPTAARGYAYTFTAMHDAVVVAAKERSPAQYAAMAGAAARVLTGLFPAAARTPAIAYLFADNPDGTLDDLARQTAFAGLQAGIVLRSEFEAGLAIGRGVADRVLAKARSDGSDATWDGSRPRGVGGQPQWWSPSPGEVPASPLAGNWRPILLTSVAGFRAPTPPSYGSAKFANEARQVVALAAPRDSMNGSVADYWSGHLVGELPPPIWFEEPENGAEAANLGLARTIRILAAVAVAEYDTTIAVWRAKYANWSPRPAGAIGALGIDPTWAPVLETPPSPGYPSAYAGYASAAVTVLTALHSTGASYDDKAAHESSDSRVWGGVQFPSDGTAGFALGRAVGQAVLARLR